MQYRCVQSVRSKLSRGMNIKHKIIRGLAKLPKGSQEFFYRMYGSVEEITESKLPWALTQVENTLKKQEKNEAAQKS